MTVNAINNHQAAPAATSSGTAVGGSSQLGQDAFMKLLIAQLKNQDPLSPLQSTDFIAQMAQLNSLQELQLLNSHLDGLAGDQRQNSADQALLLAVSLLGKYIAATDPESGQFYYGQVDSYRLDGNQALFSMGGAEIPAAWITRIAGELSGVKPNG